MASSPAISVVVPVYKVEKYLRECVESVLAQSFGDFELILVDDGSPDKSGEICDELAKRDSRIRVFHQENGGVTSARRLGVEQARGEWICFLDADDLLPQNSLKDLFDEATDDDVDWIQGMYCSFRDGETPSVETRTGDVKSFDSVGLVGNMFSTHTAPWGKIVRKRLFTPNVLDIPREIRIGEDVQMNLRLVVNGPRKAKEIDKVVYCYRLIKTSVSHSSVVTENYFFRYAKLLLSEMRKISTPGNKARLSLVLSRFLCGIVAYNLVGYGLPIKFPHRLATLMCRGARSKPRYFFVYLCLKFNCVGLARFVAKIYCRLCGLNFGAKGKIPLD